MPTLHAVLNRKPNASIHTIAPDASVLDAAHAMNDHRIGALLVVASSRLAGIFTERDMLRRVVAQGLSPQSTPVESVMTRAVTTATPNTKTADAQKIFKEHRIRHLPVIGAGGSILGLVSIGDLNAHELADTQVVVHALESVLYGHA